MSRGPGRLQATLFGVIRQHGKPMTFADIRAVLRKALNVEHYSAFEWSLFYSSLERSLRRALHRMVKDGALIAMGDGGRADPVAVFHSPGDHAADVRYGGRVQCVAGSAWG